VIEQVIGKRKQMTGHSTHGAIHRMTLERARVLCLIAVLEQAKRHQSDHGSLISRDTLSKVRTTTVWIAIDSHDDMPNQSVQLATGILLPSDHVASARGLDIIM